MSMRPYAYEDPYSTDGIITADWQRRANTESHNGGPPQYIDVDNDEDVGVLVGVGASNRPTTSGEGARSRAEDPAKRLGVPKPDPSHAFRQAGLDSFGYGATGPHRIARDGASADRLRTMYGDFAGKAGTAEQSRPPSPMNDMEVEEVVDKRLQTSKPSSRRTSTSHNLRADSSRISTHSPAPSTNVEDFDDDIEDADSFPKSRERLSQKSIPNTTHKRTGIGTAGPVLPKPSSKNGSQFIPDLMKITAPKSKRDSMKPKGVRHSVSVSDGVDFF